jgi:saccharopine dehydrogenase-like NADP-dependent oxidoreductase
VNDMTAVKIAMAGVDIVVNTCGPYFRFAVPILQAAIDSGCHYMDICDDWEPTIDMLKLDEKAKAAGICATIGLGASPGLTNLMTLIAARELDLVTSVVTGWDMGGATLDETGANQSTNAAMLHAVEQMTGEVQIFTKGAYKMVKPLKPRTVMYPGMKPFVGNVFGHPEALTFPQYFPDIIESVNLAHGGDANSMLLRLVMGIVDLGLLSKTKAANLFAWLESLNRSQAKRQGDDYPPPIYGYAHGLKHGAPASVGVSLAKNDSNEAMREQELGMGHITGIPLACGVKLLADGGITRTGVLAPEAGHIDPHAFIDDVFAELNKATGQQLGGFDQNVVIARSW